MAWVRWKYRCRTVSSSARFSWQDLAGSFADRSEKRERLVNDVNNE